MGVLREGRRCNLDDIGHRAHVQDQIALGQQGIYLIELDPHSAEAFEPMAARQNGGLVGNSLQADKLAQQKNVVQRPLNFRIRVGKPLLHKGAAQYRL